MRRAVLMGTVCVIVCAIVAASASAQEQGQGQGRGRRGRGGFGGFGGGGSAMLLASEKVQKELKLNDDQKEKLGTLRTEMREAFAQGGGGRGFGQGDQDLSEEEREKAREEFRKRMEETQKKMQEFEKKIQALLDADQNKRLKELSLQQRMQFMGYGAVLNDQEAVKELKLTDDQKESIKTIAEESGRQMRELFQEGGGGFEKMQELRKTTDEEYLAVLTEEQKAAIEKMKGEKFEFEVPQFPGRRGGPGGAGGGRRGGQGNNN